MIDVHATKGKTVLEYLAVMKGKVKKAYISFGGIEAELHSGVVITAKTPRELKKKLEEEE